MNSNQSLGPVRLVAHPPAPTPPPLAVTVRTEAADVDVKIKEPLALLATIGQTVIDHPVKCAVGVILAVGFAVAVAKAQQ